VAQGRRLLFDAGCGAFNSNCASLLPLGSETGNNPHEDEAVDINVPIATHPKASSN
jgi:hypothetical protein